ncbi:MAG TPA: N-acetyltransferase [bacterium]|nr:N-acetyltransferase [bacterium]HPN35279.1 N-acetyltransferase [bacterium]
MPSANVLFRRARIKDVNDITELINHYAKLGDMLSRSHMQVYSQLRDYYVAVDGDRVVGCGALNIIWDNLAEVRSLAIAPDYVGQGLGREIVNRLLADAADLALPQVFTLTYKPVFFEKVGFTRVDKKELPHKVWKDCIHCPKFPDCDEVALVKNIP